MRDGGRERLGIDEGVRRSVSLAAPVVGLPDALRYRAIWFDSNLAVGLTNGCFDLIHPGHIKLIREASDACDRLIVAINSDASVRGLKGEHRPVQPEAARADIVSALRGVALVTVFDQDTPLEIIKALRPDVLVKGGDYRREDIVGAEFVEADGGRVVIVDMLAGCSTTKLLDGNNRVDR